MLRQGVFSAETPPETAYVSTTPLEVPMVGGLL